MKGQAQTAQILVVEDDEFVRGLLCAVLEGAQFKTVGAASIEALNTRLASEHFDALLLDLGLPDGDGLDALRQIRAGGSSVPIVVLTRRSDVDARITALELGADDYVTKPVEPKELLLRIRRLISVDGERGLANTAERFSIGDWTLDLAQRTFTHSNRGNVTLTRSEFDLIAAMFRAPNRVLNREYLLDALDRSDAGSYDRTIDVLVSRLRKKLGEPPGDSALIQTVQGVGYKLVLP